MKSYPELVVDSLAYARARGYSFEDAWREAMLAFPPRDFDYGSRVGGGSGVESPLTFFYRHARAAWHNAAALPYCDEDGCAALAAGCVPSTGSTLCLAHLRGRLAAC